MPAAIGKSPIHLRQRRVFSQAIRVFKTHATRVYGTLHPQGMQRRGSAAPAAGRPLQALFELCARDRLLLAAFLDETPEAITAP